MRVLFIVLLSILFVMDTSPQSKATDREPVAAGRFYSADKNALIKDLSQLFKSNKIYPEGGKVRAIISPHAGYVFSGSVAASAFAAIPKNSEFKNIFIIGSSHIMAFEGASVYDAGDFITPLGKIEVNKEIGSQLRKNNRLFNFPVTAHSQEHSIEVQVPFIQYYFTGKPGIVPIIIGTDNTHIIKEIAGILKPWFTPENLFIISSDFSHYPAYEGALRVDNSTADAIITGNPQTFLDVLKNNSGERIQGLVTSMCGWTSGLLLLYLAEDNNQLVFEKISYANSGDSPYGNKDEVVGYQAIKLIEKDESAGITRISRSDVSFTKEETATLMSIARNSIRSMLYDKRRVAINPDVMPGSLRKLMGAFVTLKIDGTLRGCIGRFISSDPLFEVVNATAICSAFEDPRFPPLTKEELDKIEIEISVLGPLKKINNINEIVLGRYGIYLKKDGRSGTMLPQVAAENGWTLEEFLGYTSRDKAGLGWSGWKDADIFIYEAVVLEEKR